MATAFKYNLNKKVKLLNGKTGTIIACKKHSYTVKTEDEDTVIWGFNIKKVGSNLVEIK